MVAAKPKILVSQLTDKMDSKFQGNYSMFSSIYAQLNGTKMNVVLRKRKSEIQDGVRKSGRTFVSDQNY